MADDIHQAAETQPSKWSRQRQRALIMIVIAVAVLTVMVISSFFIKGDQLGVHFQMKNQAPSWAHPFGTDWLGRDMLARTIEGLTLSFMVGVLASAISVIIAVSLSLLASLHKSLDMFVTWLIDLFLSVPHLVILILIAFALGGGLQGVVVGVALTHWPKLTRLLRAEVWQLKQTEYVAVAHKMGRSRFGIAIKHMLPHLAPHLLIGFILLFPHAILHEAALTFLGFGLSAEQPAIGIILSEAMRYLSTGMWWLAFFPGLMLLLMVAVFDMLGRNVRTFLDPFAGQKYE